MMRQIQIGFSRNVGLLSWIIRKMTCSTISHCYVKLPLPDYAKDAGYMVNHAQGLNIHYVNSNLFLKKNRVLHEYVVWLPEDQFAYAEKMRWTMAGTPYGYRQILGYLVVLLFLRFGLKMKNPFRDGDHSAVCVEWVMRQIGILDATEEWTPEDLLQWCQKNGVPIKIESNTVAP